MTYYFAIVSGDDDLLFDLDFGIPLKTSRSDSFKVKEDQRQFYQLIVHSSLDLVDELMWCTTSMYLKVVDKFNDWYISAFVTAGNIRLMLLHEARNEESIRVFFTEVYELYLKVLLNPFYEKHSPITSPLFKTKVERLMKKL